MSALEQTLALVQVLGQLCAHRGWSDPSPSKIDIILEMRILSSGWARAMNLSRTDTMEQIGAPDKV